MNHIQQFSAPLGRSLLALVFLLSGINKIFSYEGTQGYMEAMGVPGILLPFVIALEVVGAAAIIVGYRTRWVAFALAGFTVLSALLFHADFSDQMQMIMFMKNLAISGGFLLMIAQGPGAYALDNLSQNKGDSVLQGA